MNNIIDYLKERKQIPFTNDPFNEVDGLILSELIYAKFDNILNENSNEDVRIVNENFWKIHTEEEIISSNSYTKMAPFLMKEMANSIRYKGTRFKHYVTDISLSTVMQFSALTIELPDGSDFIAFRGTDGTITGWMEDFKFSFATTDGQEMARAYLNLYHNNNKRFLRVGGHSKGGNLAVYSAIFCDKNIQDNIKCVYSFDGPGFMAEVLKTKEYKTILPRIVSVVPKECVIGIMMNNEYKTIITESDSFSIYQHDAYQWHIKENHFEEIPSRSELSLFFEKIVHNWLNRCDENKRKEILEVILSLILENEIIKEDNEKLRPEFFKNLILNSTKLSNNDKMLLLSSITDVFVSASFTTTNEIKEKSEQIKNKVKHKRR